jgi:hypothetical protein
LLTLILLILWLFALLVISPDILVFHNRKVLK